LVEKKKKTLKTQQFLSIHLTPPAMASRARSMIQ